MNATNFVINGWKLPSYTLKDYRDPIVTEVPSRDMAVVFHDIREHSMLNEFFRVMILTNKKAPKVIWHPKSVFYLSDNPGIALDRYLFLSGHIRLDDDDKGRPQYVVCRYIVDLETMRFASLDLGARMYSDLTRTVTPESVSFTDRLSPWSGTWRFDDLTWLPIDMVDLPPKKKLKTGFWKMLDIEESWARSRLRR